MAEIDPRPTEKQIKILLENLNDPLIFKVVRDLIIEAQARVSDENPLHEDLEKWNLLTRRLVFNGKSVLLNILLEDIIARVSDTEYDEKCFKEDLKSRNNYFKEYTKKNYSKEMSFIVNKGIKITDIAIKYGLKLKGNKCVCPFHADGDPSLTFSDSKGVFHCFGCNESGNILTFIKKMEEIKYDKQSRS